MSMPGAYPDLSSMTVLRALHLSGADEQRPRGAVVVAVGLTKILWSLRLDREPELTLFWHAHSASRMNRVAPTGSAVPAGPGRRWRARRQRRPAPGTGPADPWPAGR